MFVFADLWMPACKEEALAIHHYSQPLWKVTNMYIINCTAAQHIHEKNIATVESDPALAACVFILKTSRGMEEDRMN
jgi:hypothetical protein